MSNKKINFYLSKCELLAEYTAYSMPKVKWLNRARERERGGGGRGGTGRAMDEGVKRIDVEQILSERGEKILCGRTGHVCEYPNTTTR